MKREFRDFTLGLCVLIGGTILATVLTTACANRRHAAVVTDSAIAASLFSLQDTEQQMFDMGGITPEQHQQFNAALLPALRAGQSLNTILMSWHPGEQPPVELATITRGVEQATQAVILALPPSQRDRLLPLVLAIQQSVLNVLLLTVGV